MNTPQDKEPSNQAGVEPVIGHPKPLLLTKIVVVLIAGFLVGTVVFMIHRTSLVPALAAWAMVSGVFAVVGRRTGFLDKL